jgi:hypothetical protein
MRDVDRAAEESKDQSVHHDRNMRLGSVVLSRSGLRMQSTWCYRAGIVNNYGRKCREGNMLYQICILYIYLPVGGPGSG